MFIITGGGSGIGQALAHALATREESVLIIGRREKKLLETAAFSPRIDYVCADVASDAGLDSIVSHLENVAQIRGLIHNAAVIKPVLPLQAIDRQSWRQAMATNLDAPLFLTQRLHAKLQSGRVLHIGSGAAYFPVIAWGAYCVSKAALSMLTRCWQLESNTTAFASVMPGIIDTDMQEYIRYAQAMDDDKRHFFKQLKENKQLLSPATVALFLCWLLMDINVADFSQREWDIYDTTHHAAWLTKPHTVPALI